MTARAPDLIWAATAAIASALTYHDAPFLSGILACWAACLAAVGLCNAARRA